jgi:hypothetical protein
MDIGSSERLATQNLQIPEKLKLGKSKWLFMLYWLLPSLQKQTSNRPEVKGGGFL